jgi:hypothetical protein
VLFILRIVIFLTLCSHTHTLRSQFQFFSQDEAPQPPPIHVEMPAVASSSQTTPSPPQSDPVLTQILASLESLDGSMSSMQRVVHSINLRVE